MTIARLIGYCIFTVTCVFATSCFAQGGVKVGMLLPMTGPFTSTGKHLVAGSSALLAARMSHHAT
jgi:hypothetical protein